MSSTRDNAQGWADGALPDNVRLGPGTLLTGEFAFKRFLSTNADALRIGQDATMDGVQFAVGTSGRIVIGDACYFSNAVLLAESEVIIGDRVVIGWNATVADSDFHPLSPGLRIADAVACSPLADGRARPPIESRPVVIEDDAWIGPNSAVLKGVRVGVGAFVEPGSVLTVDVPAGARVIGSPARIVGPA